jgi:hypothetical protein
MSMFIGKQKTHCDVGFLSYLYGLNFRGGKAI